MNKRGLAIFLIGILATTMFAGCGIGKNNVDASEQYDENPITLKTVSMFGGTDANKVTYDTINQNFMETYPYITVEDTSQTSDEEWKGQVDADFTVGNEPDVIQFFTDATANNIIATGKLISIDEIRKKYPDYAKDTLDSALEAAANTDGVERAVPTVGYWEGLYCNKDLFEKYNIEIPKDWESMEKAIKTFRDNGVIPIACSLNSVPHYWIEFLMLYSAGVEEYTTVPETAPKGWIKGIQLFKTLRDMGAFPENTDTIDDDYAGQLFCDKKAAMRLDGSWFANKIKDTDNTMVISFPGVPDQKAEAGTLVGGISSGFYITKKAWEDPEKRDAAVKFVMAHTCKESVQKYWEATGAISRAAVDVVPVKDPTPFAQSVADYTHDPDAFVAPTDARIGGAYKTLVSEIVRVSTGDIAAEDAINEALALAQ